MKNPIRGVQIDHDKLKDLFSVAKTPGATLSRAALVRGDRVMLTLATSLLYVAAFLASDSGLASSSRGSDGGAADRIDEIMVFFRPGIDSPVFPDIVC